MLQCLPISENTGSTAASIGFKRNGPVNQSVDGYFGDATVNSLTTGLPVTTAWASDSDGIYLDLGTANELRIATAGAAALSLPYLHYIAFFKSSMNMADGVVRSLMQSADTSASKWIRFFKPSPNTLRMRINYGVNLD